ncbi:MAG: bile acid:sodium symporter family protein [Deltaproteobacteria bacterium]|nr:MAG: bile acid:sodium symporter family protein [Deltaproteobacteria bacterium]
MSGIDQVDLAFNPTTLWALNIILGLVLFGVALDLKIEHFWALIKNPRAPIVGLIAQFLILPAIAFALIQVLPVTPSMALGMLLVSACPGGNVSNFITHLAKGNTEVSVGMTLVSTVAAMVTTPLNLSFWGGMSPDTAALLQSIRLDPLDMVLTVGALLGIPLVVGMFIGHRMPTVARWLRKPFKIGSILFFIGFIALAFGANFDHFLSYIGAVFLPVLILNATALLLGWSSGWVARLPERDRRAVAIEVGIQNSGLGLVLVFNFFDGLGGMAIIAAWWGIWHLIAGLSLAAFWSLRGVPKEGPQAPVEISAP